MGSMEEIDIHITIYYWCMACASSDVNEFLTDFINNFTFLLQNGITVSDIKYTITIGTILCDASARTFITCTKNYTGYFSCPKCIQEDDFVLNRVFLEIHNTLRTDEAFKNRSQPEHHIDDSILEKLPVGMISQIPLDYMHLICLGVTKRLQI